VGFAMEGILDLSGEKIKYELVRDPRIKNSYIKFKEDKLIVLSPNNMKINKILEKHGSWIIKHYRQIKQSARIFNRDSVMVSGKKYIAVLRETKSNFGVELTNDCIIVSAKDKKHGNSVVERWLRKRSFDYVTAKTIEKAGMLNKRVNNVTLRRSKKWGLCTSRSNISYNPYIAGLPDELIEYIVSHEVSHLKELNHSRDFWEVVGSIYANYKQAKKTLHSYDNNYRNVFVE
jgi:predicted metal-dependent hydrolase